MKNLGNIIVGLFSVIIGIAGIVFVVNSISGKYDDAAHELGKSAILRNADGTSAFENTESSEAHVKPEVVQNNSDEITYEFVNEDGEVFVSYSEEEFRDYLAGTYGSSDDEYSVMNKDEFVEFVIEDLNKLCKNNVVQIRKDDMLNAIDNYEASLSDRIIDRAADEAMNEIVGDAMREAYSEDTEIVETAAEDKEYDSENQGALGMGCINASDGYMNLRSGAGTNYDIIMEVYNGLNVYIYDVSEDEKWYYIEVESWDGTAYYGWVSGSGLEIVTWDA